MSIFERLLKSFDILWQELSRLPQRVLRMVRGMILAMTGRDPQGGFVLPTVTMVILVVVLTSATLVLRSMDRAKNANNFRVSQVVLNAAAPALDRAKAKIEDLFASPNLPNIPADTAIDTEFESPRYNLDDEVRLQVAFDFRNAAGALSPDGTIQREERVTTAWRFPVDTDNNGLFDSFTVYGIFYRSANDRARVPFEARTRPQVLNAISRVCEAAAGTSASLVGGTGWYNQEGVLKRAFFTYVVNVPITNPNETGLLAGYNAAPYNNINNYERFSGNQGFTALEYQQDRARIPLGNNAIVSSDDLDLGSGTDFLINGRIITNGNFIAAQGTGQKLRIYQVSSKDSCFYEEENAKIIVAGNVGMGRSQNGNDTNGGVQIDLFRGQGANPREATGVNGGISTTNKSVTNNSPELTYNDKAYEDRIKHLVDITRDNQSPDKDPPAVQAWIEDRIEANSEFDNPGDRDRLRGQALDIWFRNRTRRVPSAEVPFMSARTVAITGVTWPLDGAGTDRLRPPLNWILPEPGQTKLTYKPERLPQANPETVENEEFVGDRILVGNNLPAVWWDTMTENFATDKTQNTLALNGKYWWRPGAGEAAAEGPRYRLTRSRRLDDVGVTGRDGFWELASARPPAETNEPVGGLRVVTGAGIYLPADVNGASDPLARAGGRPNPERIVWPDWMPQPPDTTSGLAYLNNHPYYRGIVERYENGNPVYLDNETATGADAPKRPYLKMRATAVYHYRYEEGEKPLACVSSFYDPTDWKTARNRTGLLNVSGEVANSTAVNAGNGFSNNGIVYTPQNDSTNFNASDPRLVYQSNLVYPNGRPVNPMLKKALRKISTDGTTKLTLAERSAIDTALCGLQILSNPTANITETPRAGFSLAHGTIQEVAFLDGRQIKGTERPKGGNAPKFEESYNRQPLDKGQPDNPRPGTNTPRVPQYDLEIEHRLPMEVRATVIDFKKLRQSPNNPNRVPNAAGDAAEILPVPEYMFPVSGIIYATRDDALPDASNRAAQPQPQSSPRIPNTGTVDPVLNLVNNEPFLQNPVDQGSPTDYWLDPTRRPNGILAINGRELNREDNNNFNEAEKGLTLVSNLPVYIKAEPDPNTGRNRPGFNVHDKEEFTQTLAADWSNFYSRTTAQLDPNFACRKPVDGQPLPLCTAGDKWRATNVVSDALTILSDRFRFGFRNEGDYDLRNNQSDNLFRNPVIQGTNTLTDIMATYTKEQQALLWPDNPMRQEYNITDLNNYPSLRDLRRTLGFLTENSFAVNGLSSNQPDNASGEAFVEQGRGVTELGYSQRSNAVPRPANPKYLNSSYFNNFVSPVQRRVSESDNVDANGRRYEYLMETCLKLPVSQCKATDWFAYEKPDGTKVPASDTLDIDLATIMASGNQFAGTTARPPSEKWQHFPRRLAFLRATERIVGPTNSTTKIASKVRIPNPDPDNTIPVEVWNMVTNSDGIRFITKNSGADFVAPQVGNLLLDIENNNQQQKRPMPIAINNDDKPVCYHYNAIRRNGGAANLTVPGIVSFKYADPPASVTEPYTFTEVQCGKFANIKNSLQKRNNALWYASSRGDETPERGTRDDHKTANRPLAIRGGPAYDDDLQNYRDMYQPRNDLGAPEAYEDDPDFVNPQPPLQPILQLNSVTGLTNPDENPNEGQPYTQTAWLPPVGSYPNNIHYNMVLATGDSPIRLTEANGGIANLPRMLENWRPGGAAQPEQVTEIKGSLIQLQRSAYATAPFHPLYELGHNYDVNNASVFENGQRYRTGNKKFQYYEPSGRQWGFDVGLLSQSADLFSQQFAMPPTDDPNEYFREVSRNDDWIQTLLCARQLNPDRTVSNHRAVNANQRPENFCTARHP